MDEATAYVTLGIDETTTPDEARVVYRRRLRLLHPDLHGSQDAQLQLEAERATRQLSTAWQTLQERWSAQAEQPVGTMAGGRAPGGPTGPTGTTESGLRPPPPRPTPPGSDECSECGGAPIRRARVRTVRRGRAQIEDQRCCRRCGLNFFRDAQATTLTAGWWSPTGPFRTVRAGVGNLRAWWRWRALHDVLPPLRPVVTPVVAPAELVRPVLRRPVPAILASLLTVVVVAAAVLLAVALIPTGSTSDNEPSLTGTGSTSTPSTATGSAPATSSSAAPAIDVTALPGCTSVCREARRLAVTVAGQRMQLLLVSTAAGRPLHALRFYLVRDSDRSVAWSGPQSPLRGYVSKRLGVYRGSVLRQDATRHVFVDLLQTPTSSYLVVLDLGNGTDVRDFGSMSLTTAGAPTFWSNTPAADTADIDGARVFDIVLPRATANGKGTARYEMLRWNGSEYVVRGCARATADGGYGAIRPDGSC